MTAESGGTETTPSRARAWSRGLLLGPVAFLTAGLILVGSALWVPKGAAGIDNMVWPMVLFPLIWAAVFFYTCLDPRLSRAWLVTLGIAVIHGGVIAQHLLGGAGA